MPRCSVISEFSFYIFFVLTWNIGCNLLSNRWLHWLNLGWLVFDASAKFTFFGVSRKTIHKYFFCGSELEETALLIYSRRAGNWSDRSTFGLLLFCWQKRAMFRRFLFWCDFEVKFFLNCFEKDGYTAIPPFYTKGIITPIRDDTGWTNQLTFN